MKIVHTTLIINILNASLYTSLNILHYTNLKTLSKCAEIFFRFI